MERALANEMVAGERRIERCRYSLREAMAKVVAASSEFTAVYAEMKAAWYRLRSIRAVCAAIDHCVGATLPSYGRWQAVEPLEADRAGYPIDTALVGRWTVALAALAENADAPLPVSGGNE